MRESLNPPILGYRLRYYLRHPLDPVRGVWWHLRYYVQRARRGWADCDVWNTESYLAAIIPQMLRELAHTSHGSPVGRVIAHEINPDEREEERGQSAWATYLTDLATAFDEYRVVRDGEDTYESAAYEPVIEKMRHLFDHYPHLWS